MHLFLGLNGNNYTSKVKNIDAKGQIMASKMSSVPNNHIRKVKKSKLKDKSPLERAKDKIRLHGERTGTGRIIKEKSRQKKSVGAKNPKNTFPSPLVHSVSSPNFNNAKSSSTPVKKHEISFDTSAQIEEIFDLQREEMNSNEETDSPSNMSPLITNLKSSSDDVYNQMKGDNQEENPR